VAETALTEPEAPRVGWARLLRERAENMRRKKRALTVDAVVASVAIDVAPSVVLTSEVDDLRLLTAGHDVTDLPVHA
jgi:hypothetical protein